MSNLYETQRYLSEYLLFHYAPDETILPWTFGPHDALRFPQRTVSAFARAGLLADGTNGRALDLGCAVGRSTFAMAHYFSHVIGLDYSHAFINAAEKLRLGETLEYDRLDEGTSATLLTVSNPEPTLSDRVSFQQGDAMHLEQEWENFDAVHAANLLCRLPDPMLLIKRLPKLLRPGGLLVLATPCSWLEHYTAPENWLGGYQEDGKAVRTIDKLRALLANDFEEIETKDEPFLIREHERKFQWSVALVSTWRRK